MDDFCTLEWLSSGDKDKKETLGPLFHRIRNGLNGYLGALQLCFKSEICQQHAWTFTSATKIVEYFAILTFGSVFFHSSETLIGGR